MRIEVTAEELERNIRFDLRFPLDPKGMEPLMVTGDDGKTTDEKKLFDGREQYRVNLDASDLERQSDLRNVSVKVLRKPTGIVPAQQGVKFAGRAWITPYVTSGNRQGYSIVVEGFAGGDEK
jgi:hypothetical protein